MSILLPVLTNSAMSTYRRCQREHQISYVRGYRPVAHGAALRFGSAWHLGLEMLWLGGELAEAEEAACAAVDDPYEAAKLRALLRGYAARWGDDVYDVVSVEQEFTSPLVNPETSAASRTFRLGGKLDVLIRDGIVEHKTTSADIGFGSPYWQRLTMDGQVSTYFAGARALGVEPTRCIYDVVKKPALRPSQMAELDGDNIKIVRDANGARVRTKPGQKWADKALDARDVVARNFERPDLVDQRLAEMERAQAAKGGYWRQTGDADLGYVLQTRPETPDEYESRLVEDIASNPDRYYQRGEVVRLESEEREHALDVWLLAQSMRDSARLGISPRNPDACHRYNSMCPYFGVCTGTESLDDGSKFVRLENVNAELSAEITPTHGKGKQ